MTPLPPVANPFTFLLLLLILGLTVGLFLTANEVIGPVPVP